MPNYIKKNVGINLDENNFNADVYVHENVVTSDRPLHLTTEKSPLSSKTIWFNLIALLLTTLVTYLPAFEHLMNKEVYMALFAVVTFGNKAIRLISNQPLSITPLGKRIQLENE